MGLLNQLVTWTNAAATTFSIFLWLYQIILYYLIISCWYYNKLLVLWLCDTLLWSINEEFLSFVTLCKKWPIVTCTNVTYYCCTSPLLSGWRAKMMHVTFYLLVASLKCCPSPLLWHKWRATSKHVTFVIDEGPHLCSVTYKFDIGDGQH